MPFASFMSLCCNCPLSGLIVKQDAKDGFSDKVTVVFVLGSQCPLIVKQFRLTHLSAGDLLQAEIELGSENGKMIQDYKKEGKIVPSEVTVKLLQQAMQGSTNNKFLIDGFPCNEENRTAFENIIDAERSIEEVFEAVKSIFLNFSGGSGEGN
ncbi:UMP-CMP kinase 3 [Vitis vinifera]|uniref:adenylate kinase n=1 Tax=Vitis vinifera TaxID=29760 RepID=A0A438DQG0_VITVI|nr:UMP-CMP kinase 3 [Vitis vinifera]